MNAIVWPCMLSGAALALIIRSEECLWGNSLSHITAQASHPLPVEWNLHSILCPGFCVLVGMGFFRDGIALLGHFMLSHFRTGARMCCFCAVWTVWLGWRKPSFSVRTLPSRVSQFMCIQFVVFVVKDLPSHYWRLWNIQWLQRRLHQQRKSFVYLFYLNKVCLDSNKCNFTWTRVLPHWLLSLNF